MLMFIIMVAASTLLAIRSIIAMLRTRFLNPTDLAILLTWYYTVPLAVCGYALYNPRGRIFLHAAAANPAVAMQSMQFAMVAILALLCGQALGKTLGPARLEMYFTLPNAGVTRAWGAAVLLLGMVAIGVLQFGIAEFMLGYATESDLQGATLGVALVYFAVGSFGLIIAYALLLYRATGRRSLLVLIALAILCALAVLLIRAKRLEIVTTLLPAVILLLAGRKSLKVAASRVVLGALAVMALILVSTIRVGDQVDLFTFNFYLLSEGLYAGHSLPGIIAYLDGNLIDYEWGKRFASALLAFIPRFLWPGKDDFVYAGNETLEVLSPLGATSILTEIVLQGGMAAVIVCYALMGFVFDRASRFQEAWDGAIANNVVPGRFIAYLVLTAILVPHFRDGIITAVKLSLQAGIFMVVLCNIQSIKARGASRPIGLPR